jgi:tRNA threonylcarbamoyl adenosine modification protein YeaZ
MKKKVTLALETGIYGGSICLLSDGEEVSSWLGKSERTKSEEFLEAIKRVFYDSQISVGEINEVVISLGPGSYSGLRVGFSIAKGLKTALGIKIRGVSLLDEMMENLRPITIAAVPFGKTGVCWKGEGSEQLGPFKIQDNINYTSKIEFVNAIKQLKPDNLVLPAKLHSELSEFVNFSRENFYITFCDYNLAFLIGRSSQDLIYNEEIEMVYPKPFKIG